MFINPHTCIAYRNVKVVAMSVTHEVILDGVYSPMTDIHMYLWAPKIQWWQPRQVYYHYSIILEISIDKMPNLVNGYFQKWQSIQ